jgi:glycosyltransferase involved in cell wall biosynthesis
LFLPNPASRGFADLRLAVVSPFVDRSHGTERALAEILERLSRDYHTEIHLYAQRVEDLVVADRRLPPTAGQGSIRWHKVPSIPGPGLVKFLSWMVANSVLRWRHRVFGGISCELVLSPGINCLNADVIIVHAIFRQLRELSREKNGTQRRQSGVFRGLHRRAYYGLLTALERHVYSNRKTALAAVSPRTAGLLRQFFDRDDVRIVPNGVDTQEFSVAACAAHRDEVRRMLNFRDTDFVLLVIGNDWRTKGVPEILEAMAQLPTLPLQVLVVGDDAPGPFRERAKTLGVLDRCHWEPPRREVIVFYAAADIYVSPSHEDSFGLPVAEAMACGIPAITSARAGVSASMRDGVDGFVLRDPEDTPALAQAIERLYSDVAFRDRMGESAAATARNWTWDRSAAKVWELLQDLTKMRDHGAFHRGNVR